MLTLSGALGYRRCDSLAVVHGLLEAIWDLLLLLLVHLEVLWILLLGMRLEAVVLAGRVEGRHDLAEDTELMVGLARSLGVRWAGKVRENGQKRRPPSL